MWPFCFCFTLIVDVCRNLDVTLLCVYWQFIKMFIFLQWEFSPKWDWVSIFIHSVDQQRVKVVKLQRNIRESSYVIYLKCWFFAAYGWMWWCSITGCRRAPECPPMSPYIHSQHTYNSPSNQSINHAITHFHFHWKTGSDITCQRIVFFPHFLSVSLYFLNLVNCCCVNHDFKILYWVQNSTMN